MAWAVSSPVFYPVVLVLAAPLAAFFYSLAAAWGRSASTASQVGRLQRLNWIMRPAAAISLAGSCWLVLAMQALPVRLTLGPMALYIDALSAFFLLVVTLAAFFAAWVVPPTVFHLKRYLPERSPETFYPLFHLFYVSMLLVPMMDNLVALWIAIELTTLASALLVRYRHGRAPQEAAWKYLMLATAGIVFALLGTITLANALTPPACAVISGGAQANCGQFGELDPLRWSILARMNVAQALDSRLVSLAFLLVLLGYGAKAGLAPLHTWLPDAHGEAPSPVSALLSGVLLKLALYAILRFYTITNLSLGSAVFTSRILLLIGLFSLVIAVPAVLKRNKFKRVLAFHSLGHMGVIAFGIGVGGPLALFGALAHALNHSLVKALMFLVFGSVQRAYGREVDQPEAEAQDTEEISGVLQSLPASGYLLLFGGLGLVGSPPFNIFLSEFILVWAALARILKPAEGDATQVWFLAIAVGVFSVARLGIFGGLVRHLKHLVLGPAKVADRSQQAGELVWFFLLLGLIVVFGITVPSRPIDFPDLLSKSVCILQAGPGGSCLP